MRKKDALFLCQFFYPEYNSSATLPWDTAKYLAKAGFSVGALCGYPGEYSKEAGVPLKERKDKVSIHRLKYIQLKRGKKLSRLINYFSFTGAVLLHIGEFRKYKSVIVYSNPPVLPIAAILARKLFGTKIIFVSYDVYPEVAYASDSLTPNGLIAKVMRCINHHLMKNVSGVVALTEEMKKFLLENRAELRKNKIRVIPNWAHESTIQVSDEAYAKFGYKPTDFIVSYFGNMGICQEMETLIRTMHELKDEDRIQFLIVGHGNKMQHVIDSTKELKNVQILEFLTGSDFEQAVSISSCSIVSLEAGLRGMCAPSKFYSYLQGGIPVISITEEGSYLQDEIKEEQIGSAVTIGDVNALKVAILEMAYHPEQQAKMAENALNLYNKNYTMEICLQKYRKFLRDVLEGRRGK